MWGGHRCYVNIEAAEIMWKYVNDTTACEIFAKNQSTSIQSAVDVFGKKVFSNDKFQLNESKCKELRINFSTKTNKRQHLRY